MSSNQTSRRGIRRVLVPAAAVLALGAGALVLPAVAAAATAPTIALTMPASIGNDGTNGGSGSVSVTGSDTTDYAFVRVDLDIAGPASLTTSQVTFSGLPAGASYTVSAGTTGHVEVHFHPALPLAHGATGVDALGTIMVNTGTPPVTGSLSTTASLVQVTSATDDTAGTTLATSAPQTTLLAAPTGPVLHSPAPAATVHQNYVFTLSTPATSPTNPAYTVYDNKPVTGGTTHPVIVPSHMATGSTDVLYTLNDTLTFDATTGVITGAAANLTKTDATPDSFTIVANNGFGGASAPVGAGATTPPVGVHDVSVTITIPVVFSDVSPSSQFGKAIYALSADGTLGGYGDGTFRPTVTVSRQAFVHFAAGVLNSGSHTVPTGACDASHPSAFADVPASLQFCQEIAALSTMGVVTGYSNGTFRPAATVSRQAEAAFLYRVDEVFRSVSPITGGDALCTTPVPFNDVTKSNPFCGDIEWMAKNKISTGYPDGGFHPTAGSSRQASAQFIYQLEALEGVQ